jgi:magnesium chelatase family protein
VAFLETAATKLQLSRRACDGVLRVARTIADLDGGREIGIADLSEALNLRREPRVG